MRDGDQLDTCCSCGSEFLVRTMRQVTFHETCLYQCLRCWDDEHGIDPEEDDCDQ